MSTEAIPSEGCAPAWPCLMRPARLALPEVRVPRPPRRRGGLDRGERNGNWRVRLGRLREHFPSRPQSVLTYFLPMQKPAMMRLLLLGKMVELSGSEDLDVLSIEAGDVEAHSSPHVPAYEELIEPDYTKCKER